MSGWTKEAYEKSVSSRCWGCTPYDEGWDACDGIANDDELRQIVAMEGELARVPRWARKIVEEGIGKLPPCAHYTFPRQYLAVVNAIGSESPPSFVPGCFTVEQERKKQMMDYCLCVDAWLAGASPEDPARELATFGDRKIDWHSVCHDLWEVLGEHTEYKDLLVEYLLHAMRWNIKWNRWEDDPGARFVRDHYLGGGGHASPRLKKVEAKLDAICPDWRRLWFYTHERGWLCAPKAFRMLECLLWRIGRERTFDDLLKNSDEVPGFLQCEDTYAGQTGHLDWVQSLMKELQAWWRAETDSEHMASELTRRLGEPTPVKRWLVRLFVRKLQAFQATYGDPLRLGW